MTKRIIIKFCGLNDDASVNTAARLGVEYAGFIFYPASPRCIDPEEAARLAQILPPHTKRVAVLVNLTNEAIKAILENFSPDMLQLHGRETPERVAEIKELTGLPIIKAIQVHDAADMSQAKAYYDVADMLLFDAKPPVGSSLPGGNGVSFDWAVLHDAKFPLPWFLSGGLTERNVEEAITTSGARAVDLSSSLESEPGLKSPKLMERFATTVRGLV